MGPPIFNRTRKTQCLFGLFLMSVQVCLSEVSTVFVNPEVDFEDAGAISIENVYTTPEYQKEQCVGDSCTTSDIFLEQIRPKNSCEKGENCDDAPNEFLTSSEILEESSEDNKTDNGTDFAMLVPKKIKCSTEVLDNWNEESESPSVKIVEGNQLSSYLTHNPNITSRSTVAPCVLVYFYATWCHHSARAAPHVNALPRAFPSIPMLATDSMKHHSVNTQHGIMAVPSLMLFHNGRPVSRFNDSECNLSTFANFITRNTDLDPVCQLNITSKDYIGPLLPSVIPETDYVLLFAWTFILFAGIYFLAKTPLWRTALERLFQMRRNEAVRAHVD